jgi:hypothetical protein
MVKPDTSHPRELPAACSGEGTLRIHRDHAAPWRPGLLASNLVRELDLRLGVGAEVREVQVSVSMLPQWLDVSLSPGDATACNP